MSTGLPGEGLTRTEQTPVKQASRKPWTILTDAAKRLMSKRFGNKAEQAVESGKSGIEQLAEEPTKPLTQPAESAGQPKTTPDQPEQSHTSDQGEEEPEAKREEPKEIGTRGPITYYLEDPRGVHRPEEAMDYTEQLLQVKREPLAGLTEITLAPEMQEKMEQSFAAIRATFLQHVQELGIVYDQSRIPDFNSVHFLHVAPNADKFTQAAGAFYDANTGAINIVVRPNDPPLSLAMRLAHEFRHAVSSHDVDIQYDYFEPQMPPSVFRKEGLTYLFLQAYSPKVGGGYSAKIEGKFLDNALAVDFEERAYPELAKMFPEDVAKIKDALRKNDNVLSSLADIVANSGHTWEEVNSLAEPHMEVNTNGEYYINRSILYSLLILRALYKRIHAKHSQQERPMEDPRRMLETESLNHFTGNAGANSIITGVVGWNLGKLIAEMTDMEYRDNLADVLLIIENGWENQVK